MATDPVCGMTVEPAKAAGSVDHGGETYYFCSQHCMKAFKADPQRYAGKTEGAPHGHSGHEHADTHAHEHKAPAQAPASASAGAKYTCPMHPEIVRDMPGDCPICGMALVPIAGTGPTDDTELRDLTRRLWIGVALSAPLVFLAMAPMVGIHEPFGLAPRPRGWLELALGTPVVLWAGWPILKKFWLSLVHWALNMYTLIGLGVTLAYMFSLAAVFLPHLFPPAFRAHDGGVGTYFEAAAVIVTLVIVGDVLQMRDGADEPRDSGIAAPRAEPRLAASR